MEKKEVMAKKKKREKLNRTDKPLTKKPEPSLKAWLPLILIVFLTLTAYFNTFNGSFQFDDWGAILENPDLHSMDLKKILFTPYRPILRLTFALNWLLGKKDYQGIPSPFGFHLINFLIHIANAYLFFLLAKKLLANFKQRESMALISALFFSLHPVNTETVSYITSRSSLMCAFFFLLALYLYWLFREGKSRLLYYSSSIACFLLAISSKEIAAVFPLVLIMLEWFIGERQKPKNLLYTLPFWGFLLIGFFYRYMHGGLAEVFTDSTQREIPTHLFSELAVFATYFRILLLPVNLNLDYDYPLLQSFSDYRILLGVLLLLSFAFLFVYFARRQKTLSFSIGFYVVNLIPVTVPILADLLFEHHLYLPLMGFALGLVVSLNLVWEKLKLNFDLLVTFFAVLLILLGQGTLRRNTVWVSEKNLWEDVVKKSPNKARPHYNYGLPLAKRLKDFPRAIAEFKKSIDYSPPDTKPEILSEYYYNLATACYYLAETAEKEGKITEAAQALNDALVNSAKSLEIDPLHVKAKMNIANIYLKQGKNREAKKLYLEVIAESKEPYPTAWGNLGVAYYKLGENSQAIESLKKAIELAPDLVDAYNNLKVVAREIGELEIASEVISKNALRIKDPKLRQQVLDLIK